MQASVELGNDFIEQLLKAFSEEIVKKIDEKQKHDREVEPFLTKKEIAKKLHVSVETVNKYLDEPYPIPFQLAGTDKRFVESEVTEWQHNRSQRRGWQ